MIKACTFQIQIVCPGCNNYHAVSGIVDFDTCQNCGRSINVSGVLNDRMLGMVDRIKYMNAFVSGSVEQMGGGAYKMVYSSMPANCEECRVILDEKLLTDSIESMKPLSCPSCNHKMPVRGADPGIKEFHPKAIGVINDSLGVDYAEKNTDKDSMVVFKCMTCGAGLELTSKTKRTIMCQYCNNENYLPDIIWTKLHPNKEVQPLFVLIDIDDNDVKSSVDYFVSVTSISIYSKHLENFIREYFERPFMNEALKTWLVYFLGAKNNEKISFNMNIEKIQKYFYDNLKLGLDSHPAELKEIAAEHSVNLPIDIQQKLSQDKSESVRLALAKNKNLAKDIIKKLQNDSSQAVSNEAKKHKTGLFKSIFG